MELDVEAMLNKLPIAKREETLPKQDHVKAQRKGHFYELLDELEYNFEANKRHLKEAEKAHEKVVAIYKQLGLTIDQLKPPANNNADK